MQSLHINRSVQNSLVKQAMKQDNLEPLFQKHVEDTNRRGEMQLTNAQSHSNKQVRKINAYNHEKFMDSFRKFENPTREDADAMRADFSSIKLQKNRRSRSFCISQTGSEGRVPDGTDSTNNDAEKTQISSRSSTNRRGNKLKQPIKPAFYGAYGQSSVESNEPGSIHRVSRQADASYNKHHDNFADKGSYFMSRHSNATEHKGYIFKLIGPLTILDNENNNIDVNPIRKVHEQATDEDQERVSEMVSKGNSTLERVDSFSNFKTIPLKQYKEIPVKLRRVNLTKSKSFGGIAAHITSHDGKAVSYKSCNMTGKEAVADNLEARNLQTCETSVKEETPAVRIGPYGCESNNLPTESITSNTSVGHKNSESDVQVTHSYVKKSMEKKLNLSIVRKNNNDRFKLFNLTGSSHRSKDFNDICQNTCDTQKSYSNFSSSVGAIADNLGTESTWSVRTRGQGDPYTPYLLNKTQKEMDSCLTAQIKSEANTKHEKTHYESSNNRKALLEQIVNNVNEGDCKELIFKEDKEFSIKDYNEFVNTALDYDLEGTDERNSVMLSLISANECRQKRKSAEKVYNNQLDTDDNHNDRNAINFNKRTHRQWRSFCDRTRRILNQDARDLARSNSLGHISTSMSRIVEENEEDDVFENASMKGARASDQPYKFHESTTVKVKVNGKAKTYHSKVKRNSSNSSGSSHEESSVNAMRISEQDLGSDAESLPSCEESYTASESPRNSPELLYSDQSTPKTRRISAPESININVTPTTRHRSKKDDVEKQRRRYSSVEVRTNDVRFSLEESFKEEEERYNSQFEKVTSCDENTFQHVENFKEESKNIPNNERKASCTSSVTSGGRRRKVSVFSDTSEKIAAEMLKEQSNGKILHRKCSLQENTTNKFHDAKQINIQNRKTSLQEVKSKKSDFLSIANDRKVSLQDHRKISLQEPRMCERKVSLQEPYGYGRTVSLQERNTYDRKVSLQEHDRKGSLQERKFSLQSHERKLSYQDRKYSVDRKYSSQDRKHSVSERKHSSSERKISLTDTLRAVVGSKKKVERKQSVEHGSSSPDENNNTNDKKSTWGILKHKMKKERKHSSDVTTSPRNSPRTMRVLSRNDSSSSVDSGYKVRNDSITRRERSISRARSEEDRKSSSSYGSSVLDEQIQDTPTKLPEVLFDLWSEGRADLELDNKTLPLLHVAAGEGNYTLLKTLVDVGVEINEIDQLGWPALHYAICAGHFHCAQLLLEKGAILHNYSSKLTNTYCSAVRNCMKSSAK